MKRKYGSVKLEYICAALVGNDRWDQFNHMLVVVAEDKNTGHNVRVSTDQEFTSKMYDICDDLLGRGSTVYMGGTYMGAKVEVSCWMYRRDENIYYFKSREDAMIVKLGAQL